MQEISGLRIQQFWRSKSFPSKLLIFQWSTKSINTNDHFYSWILLWGQITCSPKPLYPAGLHLVPQVHLVDPRLSSGRRMHSSDALRCFDTSPLTKQKNTKDLWTPSQPNKLLQIGFAATIGPKPLVNGHMLSPIVAVKIFMVQLVEVILGNLKLKPMRATLGVKDKNEWWSTFTSILPSNWLKDLAPKSTYYIYSIW